MQILKSYFRIISMCLAISATLFAGGVGGLSAHAQTEEVMAKENE